MALVNQLGILCLAAAALPAMGGSLAGRVTNSITGGGIGEVNISVYTEQGPSHSTMSDSSGSYKIEGLPEGAYQVAYSADGYFFAGMSRMVNVSGDARADLELTALASIHGRVLDPEGKPVPGIAVDLSPPLIAGVLTDENGAFVLAKLAPHSYTISAKPKPQPAAEDGKRIVTTYYPTAIASDQALPIKVNGADLFGYDIRLQTAPARRIRGVVIGTDGKPFAHATVATFKPPSGLITIIRYAQYRFQQAEVAGDQVTSTEDGSFELPAVLEGDWDIRASTTERDAERHRDTVRAAVTQVRVSRNDIDDLKLQLGEPFDVEISGEWGDPPPAQPPQLLANLISIDGGFGGMSDLPRPGEAQHLEIFAGRFFVGPSFLPTPGYYLAAAMMDGRDVLGQVVEIRGPTTIKTIYKTGGGSIRGTVEAGAGSGKTSGGATVVAMGEATANARFGFLAQCTATGQFTLADLPPGEYTLLAYQGNNPEVAGAEFQGIIANRGERVKVEAGAIATLSLRVNQ